jgi:hypothetical protein
VRIGALPHIELIIERFDDMRDMESELKQRYPIEYLFNGTNLIARIHFHKDETSHNQTASSMVEITRKPNESNEQMNIRVLEYLLRFVVHNAPDR